MKYSEEAKLLLEQYLWELERRLPFSRRKDILREFKSNLLDLLEERSGDTQISEHTAAEVLQEIGSPEHIAKQYGEEKVLISAPLFPIFKLVASIVASVLTVLFLADLFISIGSGAETAIFETFGTFIGSLTGAFGMLTAVFYLIQRFSPSGYFEQDQEHWDPEHLPKPEYSTPPGIAESVFSIIFSAVLIILLTQFSRGLEYSRTIGSAHIYIPPFGSRLIALIPLLSARWVLGIGFHIILLIKRAWNEPLRISDLSLSFADIAILIMFLQGSPDAYIRFDLMEQTEVFGSVAPILRWIFTGIIILILVLTVLDTLKKIKRLFFKPVSRIDLS